MTALTPDLNLTGRRILLTRPEQQQASLRAAIEQIGGTAESLPLLTIEAIDDADAIQHARSLVQDLDRYHIIIFISSNAVKFGGDLIQDFWPQFPVGIQVIAIGETTARGASTRFACTVIRPSRGSNSEAVLALPELDQLQDKRVAIVRGQGGRELLASTLRERGARVDYIEVYRRMPAPVDTGDVKDKLVGQPCDAITVHSGESLDRLISLSADNIDKVTLIPLAVPSPRVATQAREAGFKVVLNADGADDSAMVTILSAWFARAEA